MLGLSFYSAVLVMTHEKCPVPLSIDSALGLAVNTTIKPRLCPGPRGRALALGDMTVQMTPRLMKGTPHF
jgi:hypothetical protein